MRPNAAKRGYDARWQRIRAKWLMEHPHCVYCLQAGKRQLGSHVDHIVPHKGDPALFWNTANWQTLCFHHHSAAKQKEEKRGHAIGCDESGKPNDPRHHWNRKTGG